MALTRAAISAVISGILTIVLLAGAIISGGVDVNGSDAQTTIPKPSPTDSATPDPEECAASWKMETSDYARNRWFSEGIAEIKTAKTPKEAAAAAKVWLDLVREDPNLLAGAAKYFLNQEVDKATLTDNDGCASDEAIDIAIALDLRIANAKSIIPEQAPSNGYNSGVNDGNVIGDATPGIGGDRTAIKIILEDGTVIWIIARCGNIATLGPPPVPPGTTDNPPKDNPPKETPPKPKNKVDDPPATQGTTPLVEDAVQTVAPPAKAKPLDPATPVTESTETTAPGATPAPPAPTPAPDIPEEQKPAPDDPGTPIGDPDS